MTPEQYQRGYLLPPGCKDLIDALRLQELERMMFQPPPITGEVPVIGAEQFSQVWKLKPAKLKPVGSVTSSAFLLEVKLGLTIPIERLASLLGHKPFQIVADLMELGIFLSTTDSLDFETAAKVLRKYGL